MRLTLIYLTLWFIPLSVFGQNFGEDMLAITNSCLSLKSNYTITSAIRAQNGESRDQIVHVRMAGRSRFYAYDDKTELLINQDMKIMLNKEFKVLMVDSSRLRESIDQLPVELFDTFASVYSSIKFDQISPTEGQYTLVPIAGDFKKIILRFSSSNYRVTMIKMDAYDRALDQDYKMTMTYVYSTFTSIPSTSAYVKKSANGDLALQPKWQSFELLNYYTQQTN